MADRSKSIEVKGAKELRRAIRRAEDDGLKRQLKTAHRKMADLFADDAESKAPKRSGDLAASIRGSGTFTKATVKAGRGASRDYAGVIHYGDPHRKIEAQEFIHEALDDQWRRGIKILDRELEVITKQLSTK